MRDLLSRLFGWDRDNTLDDLRQRLATHRAHAAQREHAVIARAHQLETGHYLGDLVGHRISRAELDDQVRQLPARQGEENRDG